MLVRAFPARTSSRNVAATFVATAAWSARFSTQRTAPSTWPRTSSTLRGGTHRSLAASAIGRTSSTPSPCRAGCRLIEKMYSVPSRAPDRLARGNDPRAGAAALLGDSAEVLVELLARLEDRRLRIDERVDVACSRESEPARDQHAIRPTRRSRSRRSRTCPARSRRARACRRAPHAGKARPDSAGA